MTAMSGSSRFMARQVPFLSEAPRLASIMRQKKDVWQDIGQNVN
jgi:hypothetical protein